jgi:hypothetical protein
VWTNIITKYNSIPLVRKVNPDLTDYVTNQALNGVLKWWLSKKNIRTNLSSRTLFYYKEFSLYKTKDIIPSYPSHWKLHKETVE